MRVFELEVLCVLYLPLVHLHLEFYIDRPAGVQVYSADVGEEVAGRTPRANRAAPRKEPAAHCNTALLRLQGSA